MFIFALLLIAVGVQPGLSYRSVCYYTNWAQYRNSKGKFLPENVDPNLCTHIIYAFAKIVGQDVVAFEWNDESTPWSTGMYERTMALKKKNPNLKIMLGVGGWNMASQPWTGIVGDASKRQHFVQSVVSFVRNHTFDGFDNDWEYPGKRGSVAADKNNNVLMMQELRRAFDADAARTGRPHLLLSTAISVGKDTIDAAYDVPRLSAVVDFFNIMSYDIHGAFEPVTGHNSPLFAHSAETGDDRHLNVDWALNYYSSLGMPRDKMNLGIPTFGRSFTLDNSNNHQLGAAAGNAGNEGHYTGEKGFISYYEICEKIQSGAQVHTIPSQHAKYLVQGNQWVGYDDVQSVTEKACYAKQHGIGGLMYWALDLDDFQGSTCNEGQYPLINAANKEFQSNDYSHCPSNTPATPGPQQPWTPAPPTGAPQTYAPQTYAPQTYAPQTYAPQTYAPQTYAPQTYAPQTYAPQTYAPLTQQPPSNVLPGGNYNCQNKPNDFFEDPNHCESYYICVNQQPFKVNCPRGLMYNTYTKQCDWAKNVQCGFQTLPPAHQTYGPNPYATQRPVQTIAPTRAPVTRPPVTRPPFTWAPITNAPATRPPFTWAPITNAPATYAPITNAPATFAPITNAPVTQPKPVNDFCKTYGDGLYPHANCHNYVQCSAGRPFVMTCPSKLLFNPALGDCDFPRNVPSCFSG